jgi:hypothetical protein
VHAEYEVSAGFDLVSQMVGSRAADPSGRPNGVVLVYRLLLRDPAAGQVPLRLRELGEVREVLVNPIVRASCDPRDFR